MLLQYGWAGLITLALIYIFKRYENQTAKHFEDLKVSKEDLKEVLKMSITVIEKANQNLEELNRELYASKELRQRVENGQKNCQKMLDKLEGIQKP